MSQSDYSFDLNSFLPPAPAPAPAPAAGGSSVDSFVSQNAGLAKRVSAQVGVAPEVLLGQWGLETGWGKSVIPGTNNLGNIKDFSGGGTKATDNMTGSRDAYRKYDTSDAFGDDYAGLLARKYRAAIGSGQDAGRFFGELRRAGYAEDPGYVQKGVAASGMAARALGAGSPASPASPASAAPAAPAGKAFYTPINADTYTDSKASIGASLGDYSKEVIASAIDSIGSMAQMAGEGAAYAANKATGSEDYVSKNLLKPVTDKVRDSMTEGGKQAKAQANVEGDIFDYSTWQLPTSAQGLVMVAMNGFGALGGTLATMGLSSLKVIQAGKALATAKAAGDAAKIAEATQALASASRASKVVGAVSEGAMTGGSAADEVRGNVEKTIAPMTHEQLMAAVPIYAEAFNQSGSADQARKAVVNGSARWAAGASAIFGAAGGALNAKVLEDFVLHKGMSAMLGQSTASRAGRTVLGGAGGAAVEGFQEGMEKAGQNAGENIGTGRSATDDVTRNSLGDVLGGALVGGPIGGVGGLSSRHTAPAPAVTPPAAPANPAAQEAAAKSLEPNSPLSKAATAGTLSAEAAAAATPPLAPQADPISEKVAAIQTQVRSGNLIQALRSAESPVDTKTFLNDLAVASSKSSPAHSREQALTRLEFAMGWAGQNAPLVDAAAPAAAPSSAIASAITDEALQASMSTTDRSRLLELNAVVADPRQRPGQRQAATQEAQTLIGRYRSVQGQSTASNAPAATPAAQTPALFGSIGKPQPEPARTAPSTSAGQAANDAASVRLGQLAEEDGQAGQPLQGVTPRTMAATAKATADATAAAQTRLDQLGDEESAAPDTAASDASAAVAPAPGAAPDAAQSAPGPAAATPIAAPKVATPAGPGPAVIRKRRAQLDQLAGLGFDTVERSAAGFMLRNTKSSQSLKLDGAADAQLARAAIKSEIDRQAHAAASSPTNNLTDPTEAQIDAGNYRKGWIGNLNGVKLSIENPQGAKRRGVGADGKAWETVLAHHYGDVAGTVGADGDPVDVFIGPRPDSDKIYVVDQKHADGSFDEHKVMMGFTSEAAARDGYLANYEAGWTGLQAITEMTPGQFKAWVKSDATKRPAAEVAGGTVTVNDGGESKTLPLIAVDALPEASSPPRGEKRKLVTKAQAKLLQKVAAVFGKQVQFFADPKRALKSDGFVRPGEPGTIYLNERSTISSLAVFGHELMHLLRTDNPEAYTALAAVVGKRLNDPEGFRKYYGDEALGKDAMLEELISDLNGDLMSDGKFWREVFDQIQAEHGAEAKGIIAKLAAAIYQALDAAIASFKGAELFGSKAFIDDGKEVRAAFRDALAAYAKTNGVTRTAMQAEVLRSTERSTGDFRKDILGQVAARVEYAKMLARQHEWAYNVGDTFLSTATGKTYRIVGRTFTSSGEKIKRGEVAKLVPTYFYESGDAPPAGATRAEQDAHPGEWQRGTFREDKLLDSKTMKNLTTERPMKFSSEREYTAGREEKPEARDDSAGRLGRGTGEKPGADTGRDGGVPAALPEYGAPTPGSVSVVGRHYSKEPRQRLSGDYFGAGLKGSERERLDQSSDARIKSRISFYIDTGKGISPEAGVGAEAHEVRLNNLYDSSTRKIKAATANAFESAVLDAGYDGYTIPDHTTTMGSAVLLGSHSVPVKYIGTPARAKAALDAPPATLKKGLIGDEIDAIDTSKIPGSRLRHGTLEVPASQVDAANAEFERIGSPVRFSRERLDTPQSEYEAVEQRLHGTEGWMRTPSGEATKLSERQWVHVRTPSFKDWFGDWEKFAGQEGGVFADSEESVSKAVGADGEPLVVYHGSDDAGFAEFNHPAGAKRGSLGIFTTPNLEMAQTYVRKGRSKPVSQSDINEDGDKMGGVYALFLNLRKPLEEDFEGANWDGSRNHQWTVVVGGEEQADSDGRMFFNSKEEAASFAEMFVDPDSDDVHEAALDYLVAAEDHYQSTDGTIRDARSMRADGAIIRDVMDDGGGQSRYAGEPSDMMVAFDPNQLKSADFNGGAYSSSENDIRRSKGRGVRPEVFEIARRVLPHLTPAERTKLRADTAQTLVNQFKKLPSANEMAAVAYAGRAKRGWYYNSAKAIEHVFGPDAPRFAALLSAMSPQTSVEINLRNAVQTWKNWVAADRPTSKDEIFQIMGRSVEGSKLTDSVLPSWVNNSVRALATEDPAQITLSGPKVDSFMRNLIGATHEVTNDAWMANYAAVDQKIFSGSLNVAGTDPGKGPGYLAMSAKIREAAKRLTQLTGEEWTPSEVQETVWSWAKTLFELQRDGVGAREALEAGGVTNEAIAATPDFRSQLHEKRNEQALRSAGYGDQLDSLLTRSDLAGKGGLDARAGSEAAPFDPNTQAGYEGRAAERLERLRYDRAAASADTRELSDAGGIRRSPGRVDLEGRPDQGPGGREEDGSLRGLPRDFTVAGKAIRASHFEPAEAAARKYMAERGLPYAPPSVYAKVDPDRAKRIADAYDALKHDPQDPEVKAAFAALARETVDQYRVVMESGLQVEFIDYAAQGDPYAASPRLATEDVRNNGHFWVFSTRDGYGMDKLDAAENPMLAETGFEISGKKALINDLFRVVHDYFGHIKEGVGFRAAGEENAWRAHSAMFSPMAQRALTTETRGQNSWVNYGPSGESNRTSDSANTVYAPQKIGLLPKWASEEGRADDAAASDATQKQTVVDANNVLDNLVVRAAEAREAVASLRKQESILTALKACLG